ncbi:MAG TPA: hypothetical protein VII92_04885, partial [Anaerolineae bacterium]
MTFSGNLLQHSLELAKDFAVGETNNGIAAFVEILSACLIAFHLLGVRIAINLDTEFGLGAIEVDDETVNRMLAARQAAHWRFA